MSPSTRPTAIRKQSLWKTVREALITMMITLFMLLSLSVLWLSYQRFQAQAFMPLRLVLLTAPLVHGEPHLLLDIVKKQRYFDLIKLNVQEVAAEISLLPWVKEVEVRKKWPDTLVLNIQERQPVFRWGASDYLDVTGKRFRGGYQEQYAHLPQVYGPDGQEKRMLRFAQTIYPWLQQQGIPVRLISLDSYHVWHIFIDDVDMILGREHLHQRLKKMVQAYRKVVKPNQNHIQSVDLRYQNHGFSVLLKAGAQIKMQEKKTREKR